MLFDYYELINGETGNAIRHSSTLNLRTNFPDDPVVHWNLDPEATAPVIQFIWVADPLKGLDRSATNAVLNDALSLEVSPPGPEDLCSVYYMDGSPPERMVLTEDASGNVYFEKDHGDKRQKWKFKRYTGDVDFITNSGSSSSHPCRCGCCWFLCCCCKKWWHKKKK